MRRVVLRVRHDALDEVLDALLPRLTDGVHERPAPAGAVELVAHALTGALPPREELVALAGGALISLDEHDVPEDWRERRRLDGEGGVAIGGRVWLRSPLDPPAAEGLLDVVIERSCAFGTGAHPTTRMCLSLMTGLEPAGAFADLGCGAGALAIAAALLGFEPVDAVDRDEPSVAAVRENARRNGVEVHAYALDLLAEPAPPAHAVAANVPAAVHAGVAARLPDTVEHLIASGIRPESREEVLGLYARRGFALREEREEGGWLALALERDLDDGPAAAAARPRHGGAERPLNGRAQRPPAWLSSPARSARRCPAAASRCRARSRSRRGRAPPCCSRRGSFGSTSPRSRTR